MKEVFEEIKTPYKYGLVLTPKNDSFKVDCPTIFRKKKTWYMSYIIFDGKGYETWLAKSADLLQWKNVGRLMSFSNDSSDWNATQKAGYFSLIDTKWGGTYKMKRFKGQSWMSYIGGKSAGYEAGELSIGLAHTSQDPRNAHEWDASDGPVLTAHDKDVRWWENKKLYKSTIIEDPSRQLGHRFIMYYNANGDTALNNKKTRWFERIGMAVSDDMKTWTRFQTEPIVHHEVGITGDPNIQKIGDVWVMFYYGAFWKNKGGAFDRFACSYDLKTWTDWQGQDLVSAGEAFDNLYAHKPCVVKYKGVVYHFYNAVNKKQQRGIAVATSKDLGKSILNF